MTVPEADDNLILVIMAGILIIVAGLDGELLQGIGMNGFHPVFSFLWVGDQPQIFKLMLSHTVENFLIDQGDDSIMSLPVALGCEIIFFIADDKGRGFIALMPLDCRFCGVQILQQLFILLIASFRKR
ncbi:hypothetical protein D3C75_684870 [compost metagenome]